MKKGFLGSDIVIKVPAIDDAGSPVTTTAATYVVRDSDDDVVLGPTSITIDSPTAQTEFDISIPAGTHLAVGGYSLDVTITTAAETFISYNPYLIVSQARLEVLKNSFVTFQEAAFIAQDLPNMIGWGLADRETNAQSLIAGFQRLTKLNYLVPYAQEFEDQDRLIPTDMRELNPRMWPLMTADRFAEFPAEFIKALKTAQVVEANIISTGDPIGDKRRAGLMSELIGESSMMFRSGPGPLDYGISRVTLGYLTGYLNNRVVITRS